MVIISYNLTLIILLSKKVNNMKYKANKTFLDALLDDTQQNALSSLYALEPTRSGISQRAIYEAQDVNGDITGTDEDDTLHITGNLTANNADRQTYIDLKGGNNTVNIDGKILLNNGGAILLEGHGSNNSVTASGTELVSSNDSSGGVSIRLRGSDTNTLHVTGDIISYGEIEGYGSGISVCLMSDDGIAHSNNYILVDGNIYMKNNSDGDFFCIRV